MSNSIVVDIIGIVVPTTVFCFGLWQYVRAQAWKRYEFVIGQINEFKSNPSVRNALQMVDWGTRAVALRPDHIDYHKRFVTVDRQMLMEALQLHTEIGRPFNDEETLIRDTFDEFFDYLHRFEQFIKAGLVKQQDFAPYLLYWVKAMTVDVRPQLQQALKTYMNAYGFAGAVDLLERYRSQVVGISRALPGADEEHGFLGANPSC